jgi:hypothetical protein
MRRILLLAAATALAGCHHQNEPQTGAAPVQAANDTAAAAVRDTSAASADTMVTPSTAGDTGSVTHQVDPNRTGPPGTGGRATTGTVNVDSVGVDSTTRTQVDTASGVPQAAPQDTLGPGTPGAVTTDTSSTAR